MGYQLIEPTEQFDGSNRRLFRVLCEGCGEEFLRRKSIVENGSGCLECSNKAKRTATIESLHKQTWSHFKRRCKVRKIDNLLTFDEWLELSEQACFYCGEAHSNTKTLSHRSDLQWLCNGLDRLDSNGPYSSENCVPCCRWCNSGKNEQTPEEFIERCRRVTQNHSG